MKRVVSLRLETLDFDEGNNYQQTRWTQKTKSQQTSIGKKQATNIEKGKQFPSFHLVEYLVRKKKSSVGSVGLT